MTKNRSYSVKEKKTSKILAFIFCLFLLIFGGGGFVSGLKIFMLSEQSRDWPIAKGVIVSAKLHSTRLNRPGKYMASAPAVTAIIKYEYDVDGKKYSSRNISSFARQYNMGYGKELKRYPAGTAVNVYYKPDDPKIATLEPGATRANYIILFVSGIAGLVGLWGVIYIPFGRGVKGDVSFEMGK